jgi:DNA (cytosine-5)-methyltransferase 1
LTPREAARLQGFPEEFNIPVSDNQAYKQFGNSVAVPVIYAIAKNLVKLIESPESRIPFSEWKQLQLLG